MQKRIFFCFFLISVAFAFLALHEITGGFRLGKVLLDPLLTLPSPTPSQEILKLLGHSFSYLAQGCQTYVFESDDHQYVCKLIRTERFHPPFWIDWFPLKKSVRKSLSQGRRRNLQNALTSYQMAYSSLQEETKILYVHLEKSSHLPFVQFKNHLGQKFWVDLNEVGFLIQKKATPLTVALQKAKREDQKNIISSFVRLVATMLEKKIRNCDYNCVKNGGMYGTEAIFLDVGSFASESQNLSYAIFEERLRHFLKHFYRYAKKNCPELLPILDQAIENQLEAKKDLCHEDCK